MQIYNSQTGLLERISEYKRKYYLNLLAKGSIFSAGLILSAYLLVNTVEYFGRLGNWPRGILFFGFLSILSYALWHWVITPLIHLYGLRKAISDEEAATQIGNFFPEIGDKLLNTLQLRNLSNRQTDLIEASIQQKSKQLLVVRFADAIKINENRKYLKYAIYPLMAILGILLFNPRFFTSSSDRLIHFQKSYNYAPFQFNLENKDLKAFKNEDYTLRVKLVGDALPESVYLLQNKAKFKLDIEDNNTYSYTFKNIQRPIDFQLEAAGFQSNEYEIKLSERPNLLSFDVTLSYPSYLGKPAESLSNVGNLTIPEGTTVAWDFNAESTEAMSLQFEGDTKPQTAQNKLIGGFDFKKNIRKSGSYQINLKNNEASNREKISYYLNVIADKNPLLALENYQDTTLYNYFVLGGNISDDYGFSNLKLLYNIHRKSEKPDAKKMVYKAVPIPFNKSTTNQTFYYQWYVDSLRLAPGDRIEYFVQVWDNDGVNGPKSAKSQVINFAVPSKEDIRAEVDKSAEKTETQIEKTLEKAKSLQKEIEKLDQRLKSQKELDFQEKKQIEDVLKKRDDLMNEIKQMQEQNQISQQKQERFAQENPELKQKLEQLQKLMNQLLDPETKKLYDQLEKLLEQKQGEDKVQELMNKLKNKEGNTQKEIEKALEMFKRMQLEQKAEQIKKDLEEQADKQEKLSEETEQKDKEGKGKDEKEQDKKQEDLEKKQDELKKEFEETKKDVEEMEKMNEELDKPEQMEKDKENQEDIEKNQEESKQDLKKKDNKSAAKKQKKAAKSMRSMAQKMSQMMEDMEAKENEENMDNLRDILENLIQLSFGQEQLMKDFRGVSLQDPRFVKLAQEQLKLKDDAKIIEDSLYALSKRVMQIQTFVTRELSDMKYQMTESSRYIKERRLNQATSRQQFAMTSMNNLALMLSQTLQQMQQQMMAMPGSGKGGKKGKKPSPGLGELQKQLSQKIEQMQGKSGMGGRKMSEELAQMAAEQGRIREMLKQLMDGQKGTEAGKKMGDGVKDLMEEMDKVETDLVNKRLSSDLKKRQQDIITRLLESEKALRQQEEDNQRKAESAKPIQRSPPPAFEQYVKDKQRQTELLRTVPPNFSPFYKREVDSYFKKYNK